MTAVKGRQRGTNESVNELDKQCFPKGIYFSKIADVQIYD
jgi:IS30 family transposase